MTPREEPLDMLTGKHYIGFMQTDTFTLPAVTDVADLLPVKVQRRYRWIIADAASAERAAQHAADFNRRPVFVIAEKVWTPYGEPTMFVMADQLDAEEYAALVSGVGRVTMYTPAAGLNERWCARCFQIVVSSTMGGQPVDVVTYPSRNSDAAPFAQHWSKSTYHTADNCAAWEAFFAREHRAATITYDGAE